MWRFGTLIGLNGAGIYQYVEFGAPKELIGTTIYQYVEIRSTNRAYWDYDLPVYGDLEHQ